jgi:Mrp family chromosome partitioning ATPase
VIRKLASVPATGEAWVVPLPARDILDGCRRALLGLGDPLPSMIGVTSSIRGEGRTTIALGLAEAAAMDHGLRVLILDLDGADRPGIASTLELREKPGIAEILRGTSSFEQAIQPMTSRLAVLAAGDLGEGTTRQFQVGIRAGLLNDLRSHCDLLIADLPPLLESGLARSAAIELDCILMVIRAGITPLAMIREAKQTLASEPALILNGAHSSLPRWLRQITEG